MNAGNAHTHSAKCCCCISRSGCSLNRRQFMTGLGAGIASGGLIINSAHAQTGDIPQYTAPPPKPLIIQPVLSVTLFTKRPQTSWRPWGGFHTREDINQEKVRISDELEKLKAESEFPIEVRPLIICNDPAQAAQISQKDHDTTIIYAANGRLDVLENLTSPKKNTIVFVRHKSGPVYLWYEIAHNRYLRKTVDDYGQPGIDHQDVVVDSMEQMQWRLRALFGLKNTIGKKVLAIGGPSGWGQGGRNAPEHTKNIFKMDLETVDYKTLGQLIIKAKQNKTLVNYCKKQADQYLKLQGISLETEKSFVENAFVLTEVFKSLLHEAGTDAFTINNCMGTIMPLSETTACLPLSLLNDSGYTAYCESDFVVIPSGILMHHISSLPVFLNDPTYPHDNMVTIAHCTAPRMMNGKDYEPARILTHFESDYGAAPKVEMKKDQVMTVIDPDFSFKKWLGFKATVLDNPFLDICRSQTDIHIHGDCDELVAQTKGFHWMACYGDYLRETAYALKKVNIQWNNLTKA